MDVFKLWATNPQAEIKGKSFKKEFGGDATFIVARKQNREYQRQLNAEWKAHEFTLQTAQAADATDAEKDAAEKLSFDLVGRVMARTILLGWDDKVEYDGQPLPYSIENAELLLSHKEFRARVDTVANDYRNFLLAQEEKDVKNSEATSTGNSNGVATLTS